MNPSTAAWLATADLAELGHALAVIERRRIELRGLADPRPVQGATPPVAKMVYAERRRRERVFAGYAIFGEPGWDILLDLYVAHGECREVSVSSACIAAEVPPTTALRWIRMLTDKGLLTRQLDPSDRRRVNLRLAPEALKRMELYLGNMKCACD